MTSLAKKKQKTKTQTFTGTRPTVIKTYEIRKVIKAANIVEAFNLDPVTPPEYIVCTDEEELQEETKIGFQ